MDRFFVARRADRQASQRGPLGWLGLGLLGLLWPLPLWAAELPKEAPLPPGAQATSEPGRYHAGRGYNETLDFYRRLFHHTGGVRWRNIVDGPAVRAKHVDSLRGYTRWDGLNLYEARGETFIYVLQRAAVAFSGEAAPQAGGTDGSIR